MYGWLLVASFSLQYMEFCQPQEIEAIFNNNLMTWAEANSNCTLLGPSVRGDLKSAKMSSQGVREKGWIGAYRGHTPWLNVRGCYRVYTSDLPLTNRTQLHGVDPIGRCVEDCPGSIIYGLSDNVCFCFNTLPTFVSKCVANVCNGSVADFCGGPLTFGNQSTTNIVFYEKNSLSPQSPGDLQCIMGQQTRTGESDELVTSYTYQPSRCDALIAAFVCRQATGTEVLYTVTSRLNWTEAVLWCSTSNYRITDTYTFSVVLSDTRLLLFWVGIFRREFTKIDTVIPNNSQISTLCVAASIGQNGALQLSNEDCSQRLPSWCEASPPTTESNTRGPRIVIRPIPPGSTNLVKIYLPLVMFAIIAIVVSITIYLLRKKITRKVRKTWIKTQNYKNHQNSLTGSLDFPINETGEAKVDNTAKNVSNPRENEEEYDHANFPVERTERGSGYTSIHLDGAGQNPASRVNSTYDHLSRQNPPSLTRSLYDHSDFRPTAAKTDPKSDTPADTTYDHLDRGARKTQANNDIYDHIEKSK